MRSWNWRFPRGRTFGERFRVVCAHYLTLCAAQGKALAALGPPFDCTWCARSERTDVTNCRGCQRTEDLAKPRRAFVSAVTRHVRRFYGDRPADVARYLLEYERAAEAVADALSERDWTIDPNWPADFGFKAEIMLSERKRAEWIENWNASQSGADAED